MLKLKIYYTHAPTRKYKSGDKNHSPGDDGDSLFIILEGTVEIWIQISEGKDIEVARLGPGKFFGEMSLLTGEARTATVISTTIANSFEVSKEDFAPMVTSHPSFAEDLSQILLSRKQANKASSEDEESDKDQSSNSQLINQIRGFFAG